MSRVLEQLRSLSVDKANAVAFHDGFTAMTFAELWAGVERVRNRLRVGNHSVVALAGDNSIAWLVADLALLDMPVRVIPVPGFFSAAQVNHIFRDAQVDVVLATSADMQRVPGINPAQLDLLDEALDLVACHLPTTSRYNGDYEKVTFTSGSTGQPKGVRLGLETLENTALTIAGTLADIGIETHLSVLPYATLLENCAGVYAPLLRGVTIHVRKMQELGLSSPEQFNPLQLMMTLQQVQPHSTILVPQLLLALVTLMQRGMLHKEQFRFIAVGGGKVSRQLLQAADELKLPVFEGYGLSECGSVVTLNTPAARKLGTVGKPLPHVRMFIDESGEIHIGGAVMRGYLGDAGQTVTSIATGDLGSFDTDGFVVVSGRKKNLFITAYGRNVNPEWVEAELMCQLPIAQVAVFGEAKALNTAVVVARQGFSPLAVEAAISEGNRALPDYARIGRIILAEQPFTTGNGLATPNGRVRRMAIADHYSTQLNQETDNGIFSAIAAEN